MSSLVTFSLLYCIKQVDSMLPCLCSGTDYRKRQNVVRTSATHEPSGECATPLFCSHHIFDVMRLNGEKTVLSAQHRPRPAINYLQISNECVQSSTSARNIGVIFDQLMSLEQHVSSVCRKYAFPISVTFQRLETASRKLILNF